MALSHRLAYLAAERLRGGSTLPLLRHFEAEPLCPPEEVRRRQWERLVRLLVHAEQHVPYYRQVFRDLSVRAQDIGSPDEFRTLPILTKDIVRERAADLVRDDRPLSAMSVHHSGGSTGVPLTFYRERDYMDASSAGSLRNFRQAGWEPGDMVAFFWGWNATLDRMPVWQFALRQRLRRMYQFDPFHSGAADMDRWIRVWRRIRPKLVHGYASTIARFAAHLERRGERLAPVKGVFTTAETLFPEQRAIIERTFGAHAFDCYGSSEVQNIAAECPHGRMHVNADFVYLETAVGADMDGRAPLLVTSLLNYGMPFIRYRNEDCGTLLDGQCGCGSGFPLMKLDIARVSDNFTLPNGRVVHGEFFTHLLYGSEGIESFQFHQVAVEHIILSVKPVPGSSPAGRARSIAAAVAQVEALSPGLSVKVQQVDEIPLSAAGKHRFTRSDVTVLAADAAP